MTGDELILSNLAIVKSVAGRIHSRIPRHSVARYEDLLQYGSLGLIAASRHYNPATGVPFHKYCRHRIHGAILDGLRAVDEMSRAQRKKRRNAEPALCSVIPCQRPDVFEPDRLPSQDPDPEHLAFRTQRYAALSSACALLHPRDQDIIRLYYLEGRTMKEIGAIIGVNESRVSQLHSRAIGRLRHTLQWNAAIDSVKLPGG